MNQVFVASSLTLLLLAVSAEGDEPNSLCGPGTSLRIADPRVADELIRLMADAQLEHFVPTAGTVCHDSQDHTAVRGLLEVAIANTPPTGKFFFQLPGQADLAAQALDNEGIVYTRHSIDNVNVIEIEELGQREAARAAIKGGINN